MNVDDLIRQLSYSCTSLSRGMRNRVLVLTQVTAQAAVCVKCETAEVLIVLPIK